MEILKLKLLLTTLFVAILKIANSAQCPNTAMMMHTAKYAEYGDMDGPPTCSQCQITKAMTVGDEQNIYYFGTFLDSGGSIRMFLKRLSSNLEKKYYKFYELNSNTPTGFDVAPNEDFAYILVPSSSKADILQIDADTGDVEVVREIPNPAIPSPFNGQLKVFPDSKHLLIIITTSSTSANVLKLKISDGLIICGSVTINVSFFRVSFAIRGNIAFVSIREGTPNGLKIFKTDFGSLNFVRLYKLEKMTAGVSITTHACTLSSDEDYLYYALSTPMPDRYIVIFSIPTDKEEFPATPSPQLSVKIPCFVIISLYSDASSLYMLIVGFGGPSLVVYDLDSSEVLKYKAGFNPTTIFSLDRDLFLLGSSGNNCAFLMIPNIHPYSTPEFIINSARKEVLYDPKQFTHDSAITVADYSFSGTFVPLSSACISVSSSSTYSPLPLSTCSMDYAGDESDVSYNFSIQKFTLLASSSYKDLSLSLSCSKSGGITVTSSIETHKDKSAPEWIYLSTAGFKMVADTPEADGSYTFYIISSAEGSEFDKTIEISVVTCQVSNCQQCDQYADEGMMGHICETCHSGYLLSPDAENCTLEEYQAPPSVESSKVAAQAVVGSSVGIGLASSLLSASSPQGMWASMNQYQLLMLAPLATSYVHNDVIVFLEGFEFATFSFSFMKLNHVPGIKQTYDYLAFAENGNYMNSIGVAYKSAIVNLISFMFTTFCLLILHLAFALPFYLCTKNKDEDSKMKKCSTKIVRFFTLTVYIRMLLESFILISLSSLSEINRVDTASTPRIVSFVLAIMLCLFAIVCISGIAFLWRQATKYEIESKYFAELFAGLKDTKLAKLYFVVFTSRRFVSVFIVSISMSLPFYPKIILYFLIQLTVVGYITIVRPFEQVKDNLIEGINETLYSAFVFILIFLKDESDWAGSTPNLVIYFLLSNTLLVTTIQLGFLICEAAKKIKSKCAGKSESKLTPEENKSSVIDGSAITDDHIRLQMASSERPELPAEARRKRIGEVIRRELMKAHRPGYRANEISQNEVIARVIHPSIQEIELS